MADGPILIVDDEPQNLAALRQVLSGDYKLAFARDGATALGAALKLQPSLMLLDIRMPQMDGFEVCRRLKADPATAMIPVIFVTSLSDAGDEAEGFAAGAVDYITKPISPPIVKARVHTHLSLVHVECLERSNRDAIAMLGEVGHFNDLETREHALRMAAYARALAVAAGWSPSDCDLLELAAPLHDTGKIGIPSAILHKPCKLTDEELAVMQTHTRIGHDILRHSEAPVFRLAAEIALRHHERWDGSGYPDGLAGEQISESARITALADVFDALTAARSYKAAWPATQVLETIKQSAGTHFEPRLVTLLEETFPEIIRIKAAWDAREEREPANALAPLSHPLPQA